MSIEMIHDDCREAMRRLLDERGAESIDACVCDPPYMLESVVKRFGKPGSAAAKFGSDGRFARASSGFMNRTWDGADENGYRITEDSSVWRMVYDLLKPGAYLLAFSSPRTGHRMACAIEDAGFIMHPFIAWAYGSGWPKAHAVGKSAEAVEWEGWFYSLQSLKPAIEPIYMAQKPFSEKTGFANVLKHGVGAVNIDACRVDGDMSPSVSRRKSAIKSGNHPGSPGEYGDGHAIVDRRSFETFVADRPGEILGRWPANLVHDGSDEVLACFPESKGQVGDVRGDEPSKPAKNVYGEFNRVPSTKRGDTGSAARFFNSFPRSLLYHAKAGKIDRAGSKHPTVKPIALLRHLVRLVTKTGATVLDPFAGSGTTGEAALLEGCNAILIEREADYFADIQRRFGVDCYDLMIAALA